MKSREQEDREESKSYPTTDEQAIGTVSLATSSHHHHHHQLSHESHCQRHHHLRPWPVYHGGFMRQSTKHHHYNRYLNVKYNSAVTSSKYLSCIYKQSPAIVTVIFFLLCTLGFIFQTSSLASTYFEYNTTSSVGIAMPDLLDSPDVSLCIRYADIITDKSLRTYDRTQGKRKVKELRSLQDKLTLKDIFNKTPSSKNILLECLYRSPRSFNVHQGTSHECQKIFSTEKYIFGEYICFHYSQIIQTNETFYFGTLAFSLVYSSLFYALVLDKKQIDSADYCKIIIHGRDSLPYDSIAYPIAFSREITDNDKYYSFVTTYSKITIQSLPPPYATLCRSYSLFHQSKRSCINECIKVNSLRVFNKVPFSGIEVKPLPLKHISFSDLQNVTFARLFEQISYSCRSECKQISCLDENYLSTLYKEQSTVGLDGLTLNIMAPSSPSTTILHRPFMSVPEFLLFISSLLGIWYGISMISFNPSSLVKRLIKSYTQTETPARQRTIKYHKMLKVQR